MLRRFVRGVVIGAEAFFPVAGGAIGGMLLIDAARDGSWTDIAAAAAVIMANMLAAAFVRGTR